MKESTKRKLARLVAENVHSTSVERVHEALLAVFAEAVAHEIEKLRADVHAQLDGLNAPPEPPKEPEVHG